MELLQLRYFYESAKNENFSHTAEMYMVPPSSVSISIKKLEKELGCELFDRTANRIILNCNGRILMKALSTGLAVIDNAIDELRSTECEQGGEVWLLVRCERRLILDYIYDFKKNNPNVVFHISHDFHTENYEQYDIIIDEQSVKYGNHIYFPLVKESIKLAASAGNPLCERRLLLKDLQNEPFVSMCEGSSLKRNTIDICNKAGFHPNILIESDDPHYLRKCIEMDFGIAFVPELSWRGEFGENIRFLDVADLVLKRITCVYKSRAKVLSPAAGRFFDYLEHIGQNI